MKKDNIMEKMESITETSARHSRYAGGSRNTVRQGSRAYKEESFSQPSPVRCEKRVTITGPKRSLANVSILGPVRPATQVELSATDARSIGCPIFVRESGDIAGTPGCKITVLRRDRNQRGRYRCKRHIHLVPETAERVGRKDKDVVT